MSGFLSVALLVYLVGVALAAGSAINALLHGEPGITGLVTGRQPPLWVKLIEGVIGALTSWVAVGFCQVQNARRAGNSAWTCGGRR